MINAIFSCLFRNIKKQFNSNLTSFHQQNAENHELVHQMPKSLYLSVFHDINAMPKYAILRIKNRKIQNQKLKNLGERSVRVPNRVKRGCARQDTTTPHTEKTPHYKHNVAFFVIFAVLSVFSLPFVASLVVLKTTFTRFICNVLQYTTKRNKTFSRP